MLVSNSIFSGSTNSILLISKITKFNFLSKNKKMLNLSENNDLCLILCFYMH